MIIYIDLYILINFIADILCIYISSYICDIRISSIKIVLSSIFGAVYSALSMILLINIQAKPLIDLLSFFVMTSIAFGLFPIRRFINFCFALSVTFSLFGGIIELMCNLTDYGGEPNHGRILVILSISSLGMLFLMLAKSFRRKLRDLSCEADIYMSYCNTDLNIKAVLLYDSGNLLKDPYYGYPVLILTLKSLSDIIDEEAKAAFKELDISLIHKHFKARPLIIPMTSVSGCTELFVGIKPTRVLINKNRNIRNDIILKNVIIGIVDNVSSFAGYDGLLPANTI